MAKDRSGLYDKTSPFTSALYFQENLQFRQMVVRRETLYTDEAVHLHDEIEMLYIHSGEGQLVVNGVPHPAGKGTLAWLFPFHVHALRCTGQALVYTCVRYSLGLLMYLQMEQQFQSSVLVLEQGPPCLALPGDQQAEVAGIMAEMERENAAKRHSYEMVLFAAVMRLVALFERGALLQVELGIPAQRTAAWTALQYIQFNFNQGIDAAKAATVLGTTPLQLNRALRLLTGMNFPQNLALVRVRNACSMMQYAELTLPYIASYVGYSSTAAFYRNFKAVKGITPDQYRQKAAPPRRAAPLLPSDTARALLVYIFEHYREPITAASAAKALYLSESAIAGALEKGMGVSFARLVTRVRLWVAAGLLRGTALNVGDIAQAAGFGSERSLARAFREAHGCSPGQWREGKENA